MYPGFAASEVLLHFIFHIMPDLFGWLALSMNSILQILYDADDKVIGIATNDMGIAKDGSRRDNFQHGVELKGKSNYFLYVHAAYLFLLPGGLIIDRLYLFPFFFQLFRKLP